MYRFLVIIIVLLNSILVFPSTTFNLDSAFQVLDQTIKERSFYDIKKNDRILELKNKANHISDEPNIDIYNQLLNEYIGYQLDSALTYAKKKLKIAYTLNDERILLHAKMNVSEVLSTMGMYNESLNILDSIDSRKLDKDLLGYYYHINHSTYLYLSDYVAEPEEKQKYSNLVYQYKDSILSLLDTETINYQIVKSSQYMMEQKYEQALKMATEAYSKAKDPHTQAICAYALADIYNKIGDRNKEKEYLTISSINDLRSAVREYISLRKLGILLYEDGDIDRAYRYIKLSLEDAIASNARMRTLEITEMLPLITKTYELKIKAENQRLTIALITISILSIILIITVIYVYKQLKKLARARRNLREINNNLKALNVELSESNYIKEEYISYVFVMCSEYIDKLEDFRKKVNRKVKTGQIEDLNKMTNSSSLVADELKSFYKSFDTIFLNLYPNFIDDFNKLLLPNEQITPKENELLSPEMRIFALVRLGINDSIKIASFLHYSSQTVYNYRLKVRNKAISKDDFNEAISRIGK